MPALYKKNCKLCAYRLLGNWFNDKVKLNIFIAQVFAIVYSRNGNSLCWSKVGEQYIVPTIRNVCRIPSGHDNRSSTPHHIAKIQSTYVEKRKNSIYKKYKTRISFKCDFQTSCFCGCCYNFHLFHYAIRCLHAYVWYGNMYWLGSGAQPDITQ